MTAQQIIEKYYGQPFPAGNLVEIPAETHNLANIVDLVNFVMSEIKKELLGDLKLAANRHKQRR